MKKQLEVVKENQLQVIVRESGLEPTKAQYILTRFQDYFSIAAEWERKAKTIVVTNETQTVDMEMARTGRLFLKEKRVAIEKARKELKEQALREGKAIDGIANVLKALIEPIEDYLERQEKFVEIKEKEELEARRLAVEKRMEEERIAQEKAYAEELEKKRIENERLKKEAEERERKMVAERKKQEVILAKEREKADAERKEAEEKARAERAKQEKVLAEQKVKAERERKAAEEKARKERETIQAKVEAEREEKERLAEILKAQIECPFCHKRFAIDKPKKT